MSGMMMHGLGDCTPELNCGCMAKPPDVLRKRIADTVRAHRPGASIDAYRCECGARWTSAHVADAVIAELGLEDEVSLGLGWRGDGIPRRRFLTEWKPIIEEGQCGADITHRDEHHRQSVCVRARGHSGAHDDGQGCVWTGATSE